MQRNGAKLYFWTFTFRDVHSLAMATALWNQFLTLLRRKLGFRGVRVLELHDEHGCHFHVVTNKRFRIQRILAISERYGFGRIHVEPVFDVANAVKYLCKYLSKRRPKCLKGARLWAAFGQIERTKVKDIVSDMPFSRILREVMGVRSPQEELEGKTVSERKQRPLTRSFLTALPMAWEAYFRTFDPFHRQRQAMWSKRRFQGDCILSPRWSGEEEAFFFTEDN